MFTYTQHAQIRKQQRAIPTVVEYWLDEFGAEEYDHHGCIKRYFNKRSIKKMQKALGAKFVSENKKYLSVYKIVSVSERLTITMGWIH